VERYDALLNLYEPEAKSSEIAALFGDLGPKLANLIPLAEERSNQTPANLLEGHYPAALQKKFNREVAAALGFEFNAGFLATSAHPFCTELGPLDVRMTTRYDESDFLSSLYGVMHETGHGLYDQGLSKAEWGYPAGKAISLGIHESQSRLWENHVGRSEAFWTHWLPKAAEYFPNLKKLTPSQMTVAASRVERSLIRVEADEVTYDQHIILRFGLERDLINGTIGIREIPERWNASVKDLLGLSVPDAARGCLQDIHWSFGGFGYFATYSLGNLNAAQLMQTARKEFQDLDASLATGNYAPLLEFVRTRIHQHGSTYQPAELMKRATGRSTESGPLLEYLMGKYCG
jgi:carboxypeptidase Taq